jgi:hypothetical protein
MQDADLFLSLAGIAGVFVGFGALISVRGSGPSDTFDVAYIGMVVSMGVWVIVAAIAPVTISRFNVVDHGLWLVCSLLALVLFWIGDEAMQRMSPERRVLKAAYPLKARARVEIVGAFLWVPMNVALILIVLGLVPDREPALYFAAIVLFLFLDASMLLLTVTSAGRPQTPSDPAALPAEGGSSA